MANNEQIIKDIRYYQNRLERYVADKNDSKVLYAIQRLSKLPINTVHLENTGVGRSVNALKKYGGEVSKAAKELVTFWKEMVVREDQSQEELQVEPEEDVDSLYSSEPEIEVDSDEDSGPNRNYKGNPINKNLVENINCDNDKETVYSHEKYDDSKYENDSVIHGHTDLKASGKNSAKPHTSKSHGYKTDPDENSKSSSINNNSKKRSYASESSQNEREEKYKSKRPRHDESHSSHEPKSISCQDVSDTKHKSRSDTSDKSDRKKTESKREKEHKSQNSDKKSSSHSHKREVSNLKSSSSDKNSKHDIVKEASKKSTESHSSEHQQDKVKKEKHSSKSSKEHKTEKSSSNHKSEKKDKHNKEKTITDVGSGKMKIINGIGSDSGASFAEALGMCGPTVSKKKSSIPKPKTSPVNKVDSPPPNQSISKYEIEDLVPESLREPQLEPLNINIASLLPEITPNYKPLGLPLDCQQKRLISDDEALSRVMSNRNQRTKVYSGNKTITKVESLFQLCIRILQENIDALEYTGGVPYLILKPILEKATPDQLFNMEHHNPYLIEDTDELWKLHCQREFKTKKRQEMETWRDMYMRCLDEREARLNFITANIKQSQDKSLPVRTTKLAYVDSFVKPPRNIARQQAKHGTSSARPSTSTKLVALAKSGEAGKVAVPNPGSRAADRSSSSSIATPVKPKKAPLMAKALSILKNRFKR